MKRAFPSRRSVSVLFVLMLGVGPGTTHAAELVVNGDFSAGNTDFTSTADFVPCCTLLAFGQYTIGDDPNAVNGAWCGSDHTSGAGDLLIVDGIQGSSTIAWSQTIDVLPGEDYDFEAWVANLVCFQSLADPVMELRVDGATVAGPLTLPENSAQWVQMAATFTASSGTAVVEIVSTSTAGNGNDFGIDDVSVTGPDGMVAECGVWIDGTAVAGGGREWGHGLATDSAGNVYLSGEFATSPITIGSDVLTSTGGRDALLIKYDPELNVIWARGGGSSGNDSGRGVAVDGSDNAYLTGFHSGSSATFGPHVIGNFGGADVFLVKYDGAGNETWALNAGGSSGSGDVGLAAAVDPQGNVSTVGYFWSSVFDAGSGVTLSNTGRTDPHLVEYDSSGTAQWGDSGAGLGDDAAHGVAVDSQGNIYITGIYGWQFQDASLNSVTFGTTTLTNQGKEDVHVVKYDSGGVFQWARGMSGPGRDFGREVAVDGAGNVYVTGHFQSASLDLGGGVSLDNSSGGDVIADAFVVSYDTNGNLRWATAGGGSDHEDGQAVIVDGAGNLYASGTFISGVATFGSFALTNAGSQEDAYLMQLDPTTGDVLCAAALGGSSREFASGLTASGEKIYVTGFTTSASMSIGATTLSGQGDFDLYLARFGPIEPAVIGFGPDGDTLSWGAAGGTSYNVYRGLVSDLVDSGGDGLPDAGYGACMTGLDADPTDTQFLDADVPSAGDGFFYLVSVVGSTGERSLGTTSSGLERAAAVGCP